MSDASPKPRILLIGGSGARSGVPRHLTHLCDALKDQAEITVLSDRNDGGYDAIRAMEVTHREIPGLATTLSPTRNVQAFKALKAECQSGQYDLVWAHARLPVILTRLMWRSLVSPGPRLAITFHGLPFSKGHRMLARATSWVLERFLVRLGPKMDVVFLTGAQREAYLTRFTPREVTKLRPHVLCNCSDLGHVPQTRHQGKMIRLIMTGRSGFQKNLIAAARLFAHLPDHYRLDLYGPGTDGPHLRHRFANVLSPSALERVGFHGPAPDVAPLLAKADGYLLTSRYEGLPIGALEAMEAGLPAILPMIEGTDTLLRHHPYSLGLSLTNDEADARRVVTLMTHYRENRAAAQAAIRSAWAKTYSPEVWATDLRRLVMELTRTPTAMSDRERAPDTRCDHPPFAIEGSTLS